MCLYILFLWFLFVCLYSHSFSPWYTINDGLNATFQISLCNKLAHNSTPGASNCPDGTSVCAVYPNGTAVSYGNYTSTPQMQDTSVDTAGTDGDLLMMYKGETCQAVKEESYSTFFHFRCGKTLVSCQLAYIFIYINLAVQAHFINVIMKEHHKMLV